MKKSFPWFWVLLAVAVALVIALIVRPEPPRLTLTPETPDTAPSSIEAIHAFWAWFEANRSVLEEQASTGLQPEQQQKLTELVRAIHPSLFWQLRASSTSSRHLIVSGQGNYPLRKLTQRWLELAPAAVPGWTFHAATPPLEMDERLWVGKSSLALSDFRFRLEEDVRHARVNVSVFHREFLTWEENERHKASRAACTALLGEDGVEMWLGQIFALGASGGTMAAQEAQRALLGFQSRMEASDAFSDIETSTPEGLALWASLRLSHKRLQFMHHPWHLEVRIPFQKTESGLPDASQRRELERMEGELLKSFKGGKNVFYGRMAYAQAWKVMMYVSDRDKAEKRLRDWVVEHKRPDVGFSFLFDPEWEQIRRY